MGRHAKVGRWRHGVYLGLRRPRERVTLLTPREERMADMSFAQQSPGAYPAFLKRIK